MKSSTTSSALRLALSLVLIAAPAFAQGQRPLSEKENPELIGKRNINSKQINFYSLEKEVTIGRQFAAEFDRSARFVEDPIIVEYINRVGQNLALHSDAKVPFTIKVIDSDEVNAFALPGGFFYVNQGLILAADNESELAGPMAHEIGHVAARHGVEQASKGQIVNWGTLPLIFLGGLGGFAIRQAAGVAIPLGFLKFSRGAEEEADQLGAQYLWAAGYDPYSLVTFFEKLETKEKKKPGTLAKIFSSHPVVGDRIEKVNALLARFPERSEYTIDTSEFNLVKGRLVSLANARAGVSSRSGAGSERETQRPTLKRRQPPPPEGADADAGQTPAGDREQKTTSERPTLRRRGDTDNKP
ncbi:MAG: M48 family metallopeptidase [Blastocatellia bacterium]